MYVCMYVCTYVEWYIPGTETYYINKYNVNLLKNDMSAYIHTYIHTYIHDNNSRSKRKIFVHLYIPNVAPPSTPGADR